MQTGSNLGLILLGWTIGFVCSALLFPLTEQPQQTEAQPLRHIIIIESEEPADRCEQLERDLEELKEILEEWDIREKEITGYAPLDPSAVEGMCYSGDPNITASGEQVVPGLTAATHPSIPFGTKIIVPGYGAYVAHDWGGAITRGKLDLAFRTKAEALAFGRQSMLVAVKKGD